MTLEGRAVGCWQARDELEARLGTRGQSLHRSNYRKGSAAVARSAQLTPSGGSQKAAMHGNFFRTSKASTIEVELQEQETRDRDKRRETRSRKGTAPGHCREIVETLMAGLSRLHLR